MTKQRNYNDYKSVWENKDPELIRLEIKNVKAWASKLDKYRNKDDLTSGEKIDLLEALLK